MPVKKDPRTGKYFYRKKIKGHPRLYNGPYNKRGEAEDAERAAIAALKNPQAGAVPMFAEWFNGRFWREWVIGGPRHNGVSEQESKRAIFSKWLAPHFGALPLDRIDVQAINTFRAYVRSLTKPDGSRAISEKRLHNILFVLSTPLQYAVKARVLLAAPYMGITKLERPAIEFVDFEEFARLLAAAAEEGPEWQIAVLLAFEAGLRIGEIRELQWECVDLRGRTITIEKQVRKTKGPDGVRRDIVGPPKGRRRRVVMMSPGLHAALSDRLRTGHVVPGPGGARLTEDRFQGIMRRLVKRAGLEQLTTAKGGASAGWHIGRHTFATHAALLSVNPWLLQEWLGHVLPQETQRYADVARAHGRSIPPVMLAAQRAEADPARGVLAALSARHGLASAEIRGSEMAAKNSRSKQK